MSLSEVNVPHGFPKIINDQPEDGKPNRFFIPFKLNLLLFYLVLFSSFVLLLAASINIHFRLSKTQQELLCLQKDFSELKKEIKATKRDADEASVNCCSYSLIFTKNNFKNDLIIYDTKISQGVRDTSGVLTVMLNVIHITCMKTKAKS